MFIDLFKAFDTVDYSILLINPQKCTSQYHESCLLCQLDSRKQYIRIAEYASTSKKDIKCGVAQGSILRPLLFLLHVNNLPDTLNVLVSIMSTDDTSFFEYTNINTLFKAVNDQLIKINRRLSANKLSLSVRKTNF